MDCFVVSRLFSAARHAGRFKLGSKLAQLNVRLSVLPLSHQATYVSSGIITHFVCLHFVLLDIGMLNLFEELGITQVAAVNSFARMLNLREDSVYIYIYIYIYAVEKQKINTYIPL